MLFIDKNSDDNSEEKYDGGMNEDFRGIANTPTLPAGRVPNSQANANVNVNAGAGLAIKVGKLSGMSSSQNTQACADMA